MLDIREKAPPSTDDWGTTPAPYPAVRMSSLLRLLLLLLLPLLLQPPEDVPSRASGSPIP